MNALSQKVALTVIVPTLNEELNIRDCLASVEFASDVVVYDSCSVDATQDLAVDAGARVVEREFTTFAEHKNWALANIESANDWVLFLDCDERVSSALREELRALLSQPYKSDDPNGYYVARKNIFRGKWIKHAGMYPDWQLRLVRKGRAHYEDRIVHEHMVVEGRAGVLKEPLVHRDYKGLERYIERHNHYSSLEAVEAYRIQRGRGRTRLWKGSLNAPQRWRRILKLVAYRWIPARWLSTFVYMYIFRLGVLDGAAGFHYCVLRAFYEYQVVLKVTEVSNRESPMYKKYKDYIER